MDTVKIIGGIGGTEEFAETVAKQFIEKYPGLENFPPFQKSLERIDYYLGKGSKPVDPVLTIPGSIIPGPIITTPISLVPTIRPGDFAPGDRPGRPDHPHRYDHPHRPERPGRPERPEQPVPKSGPGVFAEATRAFVYFAKLIGGFGGTKEQVEALVKHNLEKYPGLENFPPFQRSLERIDYYLGKGSTPIVLVPTIPVPTIPFPIVLDPTDPGFNVEPTPDPIFTIQPFPLPNFRGPIGNLPFPPTPIVTAPHKHPIHAYLEPTEAVANLTELGPDADGEPESALPPTGVSIVV
ncbi:MAG: hypothetical protein O7I42_01825 [Alphaproteobacteria bacterium]|nr:hypothetical protein [Alphaproteobacteria bacterium]